jgi:hypothetical protein
MYEKGWECVRINKRVCEGMIQCKKCVRRDESV